MAYSLLNPPLSPESLHVGTFSLAQTQIPITIENSDQREEQIPRLPKMSLDIPHSLHLNLKVSKFMA
jgi:hypothetical protein